MEKVKIARKIMRACARLFRSESMNVLFRSPVVKKVRKAVAMACGCMAWAM